MDFLSAVNRISQLTRLHKKEVLGIYLFSAFSGLVQLSLPLGVQAIVGFALGATMVIHLCTYIFSGFGCSNCGFTSNKPNEVN